MKKTLLNTKTISVLIVTFLIISGGFFWLNSSNTSDLNQGKNDDNPTSSDSSGSGSDTSCPDFSKKLVYETWDKEVKTLQRFLFSQNVLGEKYITGYFGTHTKQALDMLNQEHGITCDNVDLNPKSENSSSAANSSSSSTQEGSSQSRSSPSDTTPPVVSITSPGEGTTVSGTSVSLKATASDNIGVNSVQFTVDGNDVGSADTSSPYSTNWDSTSVADGFYSIIATATDAAGNKATSAVESVKVDNSGPVISSTSSSGDVTTATLSWTTNESSDSKVVYGLTQSYGNTVSSTTNTTSHLINLSGLTLGTTYHFAVISKDTQGNETMSSDSTFDTLSIPSDAVGLWYISDYDGTNHPVIANSASAESTSSNLFSASRRMFSNQEWWGKQSSTIVDSTATAPDGTTDASTVTGTGNWVLHPTVISTLPAGTYTMAVNAKRNTGSDQQFSFYTGNTSTRSTAKTATSAWQRFTYTFTLASATTINTIGLGSINGSTDGDIQIVDFELYSGSADLGPEDYGGHLYLGASAFDTRPTYADGELDVSSNGYGLVQFPTDQTFTDITVQALVSKVAAGSAYSSILSKAQSYQQLSAMTELSSAPSSFFGGGPPVVGPSQFSGLWDAQGKGYHVITLRYDGTNFDYWIDDVRILRVAKSISAVTAKDLFLNITNTTSLYGGSKFAGAIGIWDRSLSDSEIRNSVAVQQALAAQSSVTSTSVNRILVAEGDSITGAASYDYPYLYGPNADPELYGVNYAVSGNAIADLVARGTTIDDIIPPNTDGRDFILSVLVGANGLSTSYSGPGGTGVDGWLTDLASYLDARRAAGWKVALCTVTPRTAAGFNGARNTVNTEIRTWVGTHADAICDFAADPTMGPDAAASNTTYYVDGTHPTAAGHAILETIYRDTINSL